MVECFLRSGHGSYPSTSRDQWAAQGDSGDLLCPCLPIAQSQIQGCLENRSTEQIKSAYGIWLCPHLCLYFPFTVSPLSYHDPFYLSDSARGC